MPIILFYKANCKAGTTIKMPTIVFYKTDCNLAYDKMPIVVFYKTDCKASITTSSSKTSLLQRRKERGGVGGGEVFCFYTILHPRAAGETCAYWPKRFLSRECYALYIRFVLLV